jgi:hypothetical protein
MVGLVCPRCSQGRSLRVVCVLLLSACDVVLGACGRVLIGGGVLVRGVCGGCCVIRVCAEVEVGVGGVGGDQEVG